MTIADRVTSVLNAADVAHALIGAAALAAAGVVRSTLDLDLLTTDTRVLDRAFWDALRSTTVDVETRRGDADDPLAGLVRISTPGDRPVDLIVGRHAWQQRAVDRARTLPSGTRVVLPRDLILLKLYAGGTQDLWDIQQLMAALSSSTLVAEVELDLPDLPPPASALWAGIRERL